MLQNMRIRTKLSFGFGSMTFLMLTIAAFCFYGFYTMQKSTERLVNGALAKQKEAHDVLAQMQNMDKSFYRVLLLKDRAAQEQELNKIKQGREEYGKHMQQLERLIASTPISNQQEKDLLERIKTSIPLAAKANNRVITLTMAGNSEEALNVLLNEAIPNCDTSQASIVNLLEYEKTRVVARSSEIITTGKRDRTVLLLGSLALVGMAFILSLLITLSITRPLATILAMLHDVANGNGDLTKRLDSSRKDELGQTCHLFNQFLEMVHSIVSQISRAADTVAAASIQMQNTSRQIAQGTEEVAGEVCGIATAGQEMASTSGEIARNCILASDASRQAASSATSGATIVNETISGMNIIAGRVRGTAATVEALGSRSDQIGAIVGTIEDIADQTNLLALNAAIEAARAGEQGRGFAVVADEVRALAERTTRATREIGDMIKAIQNETGDAVSAMVQGVREVEQGATTSLESGRALQDILSRINEVSEQVSQIATAAEEQTATTSEITTNIHQVTSTVQQTARNAEEMADAARQLSGEASRLQQLVGKFRLV